jgi:hypothetical protein
MGTRAALVLGFFVVAASLLHGGVYAPGHDFIVNRFTGAVRFVPAEDEVGDATPIRRVRALTRRGPDARVRRSVAPRGACDPTWIGR